ncbi:MAG: DUF4241 domain-containing protein [Maricaulis sp.]|nr:DUF4241 domain-containing protein [Maricaulis sp.]
MSSIIECGALVLPSGRLVACDPFSPTDEYVRGFTHRVRPGQYPVRLALGEYEDGDRRIGLAQIVITDQPVTRWEFALTIGQSPASIDPDYDIGYYVNGALGCFADELHLEKLFLTSQDQGGMRLFNEVSENEGETYSWKNLGLEVGDSGDVALFSSGDGDGCYPTYIGFDEAGRVTSFVTDFYVFGILVPD